MIEFGSLLFLDDSSSFWIGLVRVVALDPEDMISSNFKRLMQHIRDSITTVAPDGNALSDAAYRAVTTMGLVTPQIAFPEISEHVRESLDPQQFTHIGSFELGVWSTPPGQTYYDGKHHLHYICFLLYSIIHIYTISQFSPHNRKTKSRIKVGKTPLKDGSKSLGRASSRRRRVGLKS